MLRCLCLLVGLGSSMGAVADAAKLQTLLRGIESLRGRFVQQMYSEEPRQLLETSTGRFDMLQPGYLRWHILEPEEQQLVAADGYLWHYDVELETATRRLFDAKAPQSPLAILAGDGNNLLDHYEVIELASTQSERSWLLEPLFEKTEFKQVTVVFRAKLPARMEVLDPLERTTTIVFQDLQLNPPLTGDSFSFTPPPGTDVYEHR